MAENLGTLGTAFIDIVAGTDKVESQMSGLQRTVRGVATAIGVTLTAAGIVKVFKDVVGAASDFESSFAGIRKTLDASEGEFAAMSDGMRQLAKEIPVPVNELNRIGETAGQLGIAKEAVLGFTRTVAGMAIATNMTSEEAATSMAKLANVMGDSQADFDRMGSAVNELGAAGSATESEILSMSIRFASAGKQIGLTTPEILGFAAAMVGVGVESEAGGTALNKTFTDIQTAVATGSKELSLFAKIALPESNNAVREFSALFREDAAGAINLFIEGLGNLDAEEAVVALTDLGIAEQRQRNALTALSLATVGVGESMKVATRAYQENTSLLTEVEKRTQTFDSQVILLKSSINDLAISAGNALLPSLRGIVSGLSGFLDQASRGEGAINSLAGAVIALAAAFAAVKIAGLVQSFIALGTISTGGGALAGLGGGLANAATATFSLRTAALAAGPALLALVPAALIASVAFLGYELGNVFGKLKELASAQGNLAVSEQNAEQQTLRLYAAIRDKYGVEIPRAGRSTEEWRKALHEFARTADPAQNKTVQLAEAARKKEEADKKAKERTAQLTEEQKKLNAEFQAALKPADDLNASLVRYKGATDADLISVFKNEIMAAAEAQRQHGFAVTGTVARLEAQIVAVDRAKAAHEAMNNVMAERATIMEKFRSASQSFLEDIAPDDDLGGVLGASRKARQPQEDQLKALDATVGARAFDSEQAAREQIRQTTEAVIAMFEAGASTDEVLARLGSDIDRAAASSKQFHVELNPTVEALIRHEATTKANQKAVEDFQKATEAAAQAWRDHWANAMAGVSDAVQDGLSRLGDEKIGTIFGDIGKDAGNIFVDAFQVQLEAPMDNLFATWGAKLAGHLSKAISGISSKVSGLFGIGGGLIGEIANAGIGMAISSVINLGKNLIGKGHRTANEFVQGVENPFGEELDRMVSAFNRERAAGSLSQDDVDRTRDAVTELINSFMRASNDFAAQGDTQAKVVAQSQAHMEELFGPGFENILSGLDIVIGDLETGANALKEEIQAALEQAQREDRFQAALKPADELNEELAKMAEHSPADLVAVFGREILAAARAQREHGYAVGGMVAELEPLATAVAAMNDTTTGTPKWQPRIAANITDAQREALGLMTANQNNAAVMAAAVAVGAPTVAAMNIPYDATRAASQIFSDAVGRFVPAVDAMIATGALGGNITIEAPLSLEVNLNGTEIGPLEVREKVAPELMILLETGGRGFLEALAAKILKVQQGITASAVPTTA